MNEEKRFISLDNLAEFKELYDEQQKSNLATSLFDKLAYKGHVDSAEDLPTTSQESATPTELNLTIDSTTNIVDYTNKTNLLTSFLTYINPEKKFFLGTTYYKPSYNDVFCGIVTDYPECIDGISISSKLQSSTRILTYFAVHISYDADKPVYYKVNREGLAFVPDSTGMEQTKFETDILNLIDESGWIPLGMYNVSSPAETLIYSNLDYIKFKHFDGTTIRFAGQGAQVDEKYTSITNNNYTFVDGSLFIKFKDNLGYWVSTDPLIPENSIYTVGENNDIYRLNEQLSWELWSVSNSSGDSVYVLSGTITTDGPRYLLNIDTEANRQVLKDIFDNYDNIDKSKVLLYIPEQWTSGTATNTYFTPILLGKGSNNSFIHFIFMYDSLLAGGATNYYGNRVVKKYELRVRANFSSGEITTITSNVDKVYSFYDDNNYVLGLNNTKSYTPSGDYNPATKKYVDDTIKSDKLVGTSAPTTATVGYVGQQYTDTSNNNQYVCTIADTTTPSYTWVQINGGGSSSNNIFVFNSNGLTNINVTDPATITQLEYIYNNFNSLTDLIVFLKDPTFGFVNATVSLTNTTQLYFRTLVNTGNWTQDSLGNGYVPGKASYIFVRFNRDTGVYENQSGSGETIKLFTNSNTFLRTNNTTAYTPTGSYHPTTKKYVDDLITTTLSSIAPAYDNTKTYNTGDYTIYNNQLYVCNTDIQTAEDFDSTKWDTTTIAEILGNIKSLLGGI